MQKTYDKSVVGWSMQTHMKKELVIEALNQAIGRFRPTAGLLLHSDQGSHYTSLSFIQLVKNSELRQSMSRRANCWDNAPQESFFGHMKDEIHIEGCNTYRVLQIFNNWRVSTKYTQAKWIQGELMRRQRLCRESLLTMRVRHVRLSGQASTTSRALLPCSAWGMPLMPANMPAEARCQEDRGINAET